MVYITSTFDSGNITPVGDTGGSGDIRLQIRADHQSDFFQWFYFRAAAPTGTEARFVIENAGDAAYSDGWEDYQVCASYDRDGWFRLPTTYAGGALSFTATFEAETLYFAYFAPFTSDRHERLIGAANASPLAAVTVLGETLDGRTMDLITIGDKAETGTGAKKNIWMIARQHPGETMAEWWMEGALEVLLNPDHPITRRLLAGANLYLVPNMNPDGSARGHLRTNAAGVNLNRVWDAPKPATEPEVALVRQKMLETGVDAHLDVHGDEALPYNFIAGFEGIPTMRPGQLDLLHRYKALLATLSTDFQVEYGYDIDPPASSDLKKCTDWTAERFGCLAMTLEMPFKDNAHDPNPVTGWSPARSKHLAESCLQAFAIMLDEL